MKKAKLSAQIAKCEYAAPAADALLSTIEYLAQRPQGAGVSEISRGTNVGPNLVFRIMKCLQSRGYVRAGVSVAYTLTPKWISLGGMVARNFDAVRLAHDFLEEMASSLNFTALFQMLSGDEMLVADCAAPQRAFYLQVMGGARLEVRANAFGKAVLAHSGAETLARIIKRKLIKGEDFKRKAYEDELAAVRQSGLAYDLEEYTRGIFCIASPVFAPGGAPAGAIGVTGLISHLSESKLKETEILVKDNAKKLTCLVAAEIR